MRRSRFDPDAETRVDGDDARRRRRRRRPRRREYFSFHSLERRPRGCHVAPSPRAVDSEALAELLRVHLDSESASRRGAAALALGSLQDAGAAEALIELLDDPSAGIRENAHWALTRITGLRFPLSPLPWRSWYRSETEWFQGEYVRHARGLGSSDPAVVTRAIRELGQRRLHRDTLALELAEVLYHPSPPIRLAACLALRELGSRAALPELVEALEDGDGRVREAAWSALRSLTLQDLPPDREAWLALLRELGFPA